MELIGINERVERIKKRITKEYVFDEAGEVVIDMQADLIWTIEAIAQLETANDRLRFRECPVCGRRIVVLHELAAHMTGNEPCPGSCSLVRVDS